MELSRWYKENETDRIWWYDNGDIETGIMLFSFDRQKVFNLFRDYPYALTAEQKRIFDEECPYWAEFFKDRTQTR